MTVENGNAHLITELHKDDIFAKIAIHDSAEYKHRNSALSVWIGEDVSGGVIAEWEKMSSAAYFRC